MCREYILACLNWWCLPASMANLSGSLMKNVHCFSTKQHGGIKSGILRSKNSTISQVVCADALSCWKVQSQANPTSVEKWLFWAFLWLQWCKIQHFVISEPDEVYYRCRAAVQQLSAPVVTSKFVLTAHYDASITLRLAKNIQLPAIFCPNIEN